MEELTVSDGQLMTLLRQRRSVRRYRKRPVPRELLEKLVDAAHTAPTGTGQNVMGLVVIESRERIEEMMKIVHELYASLEKALQNPIGRFMVRRRAGKAKLAVLEGFVMPGMHWYLRWYREGRSDEISRDCPAMLIFHGPSSEPQADANCTLAAFHSILAAETLGLGTCFNHLIPPVINRSDALRDMLSIPKHNESHTAVTVGFPKYKWKRSVPHRLAEVKFIT
jgi:nitroreductase